VEVIVDMEVNHVSDDVMNTEDGEFVDYNNEEVVAFIIQKAAKVALRETSTRNGFAFRPLLLNKHTETHYFASPMG
jgi:hypothetical protein